MSWSQSDLTTPPDALRAQYLNGLLEPQELFVEDLVRQGVVWVWSESPDSLGYAVVAEPGVVEFYVDACGDPPACFDLLLETTSARSALVKSFDALFLAVAQPRSIEQRTVGFLYRAFETESYVAGEGLLIRSGTLADVDAVLAINDGFFVDRAEVEHYAAQGGLVLLSDAASGKVVGCGIAKPVVPGRHDIDIGMYVAPEHRRRGYGACLISYLKVRCLQRGERPICGCSADNLASQRTLARAGFRADHKLLAFDFG